MKPAIEPAIELCERITRWRVSRVPKVTKSELARRVGVTVEAVIQWESGKYEPTHENVRKIAAALDLTEPGFWGEPPDVDVAAPKKRKARAS